MMLEIARERFHSLGIVRADTKVSLKLAATDGARAEATLRRKLSACASSSAMLTTCNCAWGRAPQERNASARDEQMSPMAEAAAAVKLGEADDAAASTKQTTTRNERRLSSSSGRRIPDDANATAAAPSK
jgi:hypothetical protein